VWAPFIERCLKCHPRRSYEILDGFIPGKTSTTMPTEITHTVTLPTTKTPDRGGG
jgi:hypothetical protein